MSKETGKIVIPAHIAIIMDGNGRWAKRRALPLKLGHRQGAETLRKVTDAAIELGVRYLTAYAFSTENWKRSEEEVGAIMDLMNSYLDEYTKDAEIKNTKVRIIGDITRLRPQLIEKIKNIQAITKDKTGLGLNIAINYGGRDEIVRAAKKMMRAAAEGALAPEDLTEGMLSDYLDTAEVPDPDLLIRTSGEYRISNFLLWQMAYSEMYFTDKLWPDFTKADLQAAIEFFNQKDRRFGGRTQ